MKAFDALNQLTDIDPAFLADAETVPAVRRFPLRWMAAVAACLVLVGTAFSVLAFDETPSPKLITEYPLNIMVSYGSPGTGETIIEMEVDAALKHYKGKNVVFWVSLYIESGDDCVNFNEAQTAVECERLRSLGYDVFVRKKDWIGYWGEQKHYTSVCLKMTANEIKNFGTVNADQPYGYMIGFNGGSPDGYTPFS